MIARWNTPDPLAEKYDGYSPYGYANNDPILFIDPNGKEIWIDYGDKKRVEYKNGKLYNEDGTKYKGKDSFVAAISKQFNKMNTTDRGKAVLKELSGSKNSFNYTNTAAKSGNNNVFDFNANKNGGGEIHAAAVMNDKMNDGSKLQAIAHETFHGFQSEFGEGGQSVNVEVGAYLFGAAVAMNAGYGIGEFGTFSKEGQLYESAMKTLLYGNDFNQAAYNQALNSFKPGSINNNGNNPGLYKNFVVKPNDANPVIKKFFPLVR